MKLFRTASRRPLNLAACAIVLVIATSGCRQFAISPEMLSSSDGQGAVPDDPFQTRRDSVTTALGDWERQLLGYRLNDKGEFVEAAEVAWRRTESQQPSDYRWSHPGLGAVLLVQGDQRLVLKQLAKSKNPVVAATAIVGLGRLEPGQHNQELFEVASRGVMPVPAPLRCAAIETLAMGGASAQPLLNQLWQQLQQGSSSGAAAQQIDAALSAELIYARLRRGRVTLEDPMLTAALAHPSEELRVAVLRAVAAAGAQPSPELLHLLDAGQAVTVRLAAFEILAKNSQNLAAAEIESLRRYTHDLNPRIRVAALQVLASTKDPANYPFVAEALQAADLPVKLAAIECLGVLGDEQSLAVLRSLRTEQPERIREAAVVALATLGDVNSVLASAEDESWRVRRNVAQALSRTSEKQAIAIARRYASDANIDVRLAMVAALETWPAEAALPILLTALAAADQRTVDTAFAIVRSKWPEAAFPVNGTHQQRRVAAEELQRQWAAKSGRPPEASDVSPAAPKAPAEDQQEPVLALSAASDDVAPKETTRPAAPEPIRPSDEELRRVEQLVATFTIRRKFSPDEVADARQQLLTIPGPTLLAALEQLCVQRGTTLTDDFYSDVLAQVDDSFAPLVTLQRHSGDDPVEIAARREASNRLASLAAVRLLPALAVRRLAEVSATESDPAVWLKLLEAVDGATGEPAERLRTIALGHEAAGVRLAACRQFHAEPRPRHASVLMGALEDSDPQVVKLAAEALGRMGPIDDVAPLQKTLMEHPSAGVQTAAAISLARVGSSSGPAALERLARHPDETIRIQAVTAMGTLLDPQLHPEQYTATLISVLTDRPAVQKAAQQSLAAINKDAAPKELASAGNLAEKSRVWREWYSGRQ